MPPRIAVSRDEAERLKFWSGRKNAFPASGRLSPDYMCMDSTIPRKRLADILLAIQQMEKKYGLRCANVFHAGDGNLHPLILFDANDADQLHRAELFGAEILETSVAMGGTVTGEHGVGVEKLNSMCVQFSRAECEQMFGVKRAFDTQEPAQPGQGDTDAESLRRIRKDAGARRPDRASGPAAVLTPGRCAPVLYAAQGRHWLSCALLFASFFAASFFSACFSSSLISSVTNVFRALESSSATAS